MSTVRNLAKNKNKNDLSRLNNKRVGNKLNSMCQRFLKKFKYNSK